MMNIDVTYKNITTLYSIDIEKLNTFLIHYTSPHNRLDFERCSKAYRMRGIFHDDLFSQIGCKLIIHVYNFTNFTLCSNS